MLTRIITITMNRPKIRQTQTRAWNCTMSMPPSVTKPSQSAPTKAATKSTLARRRHACPDMPAVGQKSVTTRARVAETEATQSVSGDWA